MADITRLRRWRRWMVADEPISIHTVMVVAPVSVHTKFAFHLQLY